ncbi:hypothetical protein PMKS-002621 [Pichia membranifaciens]|uniref:C2H2-type domain-containing protein n=1 Tax=Pichia membranifaciens TaxID=4926 RepID=A0A1Q2YI33_9ASCO|nr:hypothetical protein PMKS-002621 [Pichia membranifaciens]
MMSSQLPQEHKAYYYPSKANQYRNPNFQSPPLVQSIDQYLVKQQQMPSQSQQQQQQQQQADSSPQIQPDQTRSQHQLHHLPQMYQPNQTAMAAAQAAAYSYQTPAQQYNNYTTVNELQYQQQQQQQQQQLPPIQQLQQNRTPSPPQQPKLSSSIQPLHNQYYPPQSQYQPQNLSPIQSQPHKYQPQGSFVSDDLQQPIGNPAASANASLSHQPTLSRVQTYPHSQSLQPLQQINNHMYQTDSYYPSESVATQLQNPQQHTPQHTPQQPPQQPQQQQIQAQDYSSSFLPSNSDLNNIGITSSVKRSNPAAASTIANSSSINVPSQSSAISTMRSQNTSANSIPSQYTSLIPPDNQQVSYHQVHVIPQQVQQSQNYGYYQQLDANHHDSSSYAPQYNAAIHPEVYHVNNYSHNAYNNPPTEPATYATSTAPSTRNTTVIGVIDNGVVYDSSNMNDPNLANPMSVPMSISAEGSVSSNLAFSEDMYVKRRNTHPIIISSKSVKKNRICPLCRKVFNRPSGLKTHMHIHTGEKPYRCDWPGCGKYFSVRSNMIRHNKIHKRYEWKNDPKNNNSEDGSFDDSINEDHKHVFMNSRKTT